MMDANDKFKAHVEMFKEGFYKFAEKKGMSERDIIHILCIFMVGAMNRGGR